MTSNALVSGLRNCKRFSEARLPRISVRSGRDESARHSDSGQLERLRRPAHAGSARRGRGDSLGGGQEHHLSDFSYVWGQFTDHDLDLTLDNSGDTSLSILPDTAHFPNDPMGLEPFTVEKWNPKKPSTN